MIVFRGSHSAVLQRLYGFFSDPDFRDDHGMLANAQQAISDVRAGAWLAVFGSWVFEVVDPPMTIEQDVYACTKGQACTSVPARLRPELDAMVAARVAAGRGTDDRHFHWYWTLDRRIFRSADVHSFVMETVGSPVVADVARMLYDSINHGTSYSDNTDVHVALLPDRIRLRIDNEGGRIWEGDLERLPDVRDPNGDPVRIVDLLAARTSRRGVVGAGAYCVWADFRRNAGDATQLATTYTTVPAAEIPPGAYVYRATDHMAWVPVTAVEVVGNTVRLEALDQGGLPTFAANELVPIFDPALSQGPKEQGQSTTA